MEFLSKTLLSPPIKHRYFYEKFSSVLSLFHSDSWRFLVVLTLFMSVFGLVIQPKAADDKPTPRVLRTTEYELKAAFIYKFSIFVDWPVEAFADSTDPLVVGVLCDDSVEKTIVNTIDDKSVKGRPLKVISLQSNADYSQCHLLFISTTYKNRFEGILKKVQGKSILTVGEMEAFAHKGGIINFIKKDRNIHFEINIDAADRAGIKISSKLLRLAVIVRDESQ